MGVEIISEVVSTKVNMPAWMLLGQVNLATPVPLYHLVGGAKDGIPVEEFFAKNTPLSPEWKERSKTQLLRWQTAFPRSEFDVGCAKSAQHQIRLFECISRSGKEFDRFL